MDLGCRDDSGRLGRVRVLGVGREPGRVWASFLGVVGAEDVGNVRAVFVVGVVGLVA